MKSDDLNALLNEAGVGSWQAALGSIGVAVVKAVAPQLLDALQRLAVTGAVALVQRMQAALMPQDSPDYALRIVEGIERDHGPGGSMELWPGPQRAEYARDAIRQWAIDQGAAPDDAMVNMLVEGAVNRLKAKQTAAAKALQGR
jgi:hypothetical protein